MLNFWGAVDFAASGGNTWIHDSVIPLHPDCLIVPSGICALGHCASTVSQSPLFPHLSIAASAELHNRDDLIRATGAERSGLIEPSDTELLLAAYAKWGEECPNHLLGEFAFAVWDERRRALYCCRDHIGFRAFVYWRNKSRFIFASDIQAVLAFEGVPRELNRRKIAAFAIPTGNHFYHQETFHKGIFSLPGGAWMTVEDGRTRQETYWEPKAAKVFVPRRQEEVFEGFREILFRAVECRLDRNRPVAALLSGGLDSSAITAIAARCLEKQNRELTAISAVVPDERRAEFPDERDYIDEFRSWPNVRIRYVTAPGRGPFDSLHDANAFRVFPALSPTYYLIQELDKAALGSGAQSLLGGFGGEWAATAWGSRYFLEMALRLKWRPLLKELGYLRARRNVSPLRFLAGQAVSCIFPSRFDRPFVLLTRAFRRECRARPSLDSSSPYQREFQAALLRHGLSKHAMRGQPAINPIRQSYPLLDKRVLEFCLAMDPALSVRDGYQRYLIRRAMEGVLPARIQWRTDKVDFSPDYPFRYNAQVGLARDLVASIGSGDPVRTIVDVDELARLLKPDNPAGATGEARLLIPVTIYLIGFLRQFSEFQAG